MKAGIHHTYLLYLFNEIKHPPSSTSNSYHQEFIARLRRWSCPAVNPRAEKNMSRGRSIDISFRPTSSQIKTSNFLVKRFQKQQIFCSYTTTAVRSVVHDVWSPMDSVSLISIPFPPDHSVLYGIGGGGGWTQSYHPLLPRKYINKLRCSYLVCINAGITPGRVENSVVCQKRNHPIHHLSLIAKKIEARMHLSYVNSSRPNVKKKHTTTTTTYQVPSINSIHR